MKGWIFALLLAYIVGVSAYDGYLVLANESIQFDERNIIGQYLLCHGGPGVLVRVKAAGTLLAFTALVVMWHRWRKAAWVSCVSLAAFQSYLLFAWLL